MATPNIVPRADQEGGLGTAAKSWGKLFIENATAGGTAAATISNLDVDKVALDINALNTTANIIDIDATTLTSGNAIFIDAAEGAQPSILIDQDSTTTATANGSNGMLGVQYNKTGVTADSANNTQIGAYASLQDAATNHSGSTVSLTAFKGVVDFANSTGTTSATGLELTVTDAATNRGIVVTNEDGGTDFQLNSSADTGDNFSIVTTTHGATTLKTTDDDAAAAHIVFEADGNVDVNGLTITLDAATGIELEAATVVTGAVTGTNYRTIYVDAGSMVPAATNGADAGTEEMHATNFTTLDYLAFDTSTEEYADFKLVMPEQYNNGTIKAKFYWKPADAEASVSVVWGIKAYAAVDSDTLVGGSGVWGTEQVIEDVSLNTVDDLHISAATPALTIAGTPAEGKLVFVRVFRKVADGNDDYADDAELLGVNIQYTESSTASAAW